MFRKQGRPRVARFAIVSILLVCYAVCVRESKPFAARNPWRKNCGLLDGDLQNDLPHRSREERWLQIVVLTMNRDTSLRRLLTSLARAHYHNQRVDLFINIDKPVSADRGRSRVVATSRRFRWDHGKKSIVVRSQHFGLAQSWFNAVSEIEGYEFIAILEDDMHVHTEFYTFFALVEHHGVMRRETSSAFCLHPDDWEVSVRERCDPSFSPLFYESPEPCNWGPIWKSEEWREYLEYVQQLQSKAELPFVPGNISYNYNMYLAMNLDVQSPWVWRYNWERSRRHIRYHSGCAVQDTTVVFMAENHAEAGEHFTKSAKIGRLKPQLARNLNQLSRLLLSPKAYDTQPFSGYDVFAKPLIPVG